MLNIRKKVAPHWWRMGESADAPEFLIRPLTQLEYIDVIRELDSNSSTITGRGVSVTLLAVKDWRNVMDEKGEARFSREALEQLDWPVLLAIASEVMNSSRLSETERKNSSSPSTSN